MLKKNELERKYIDMQKAQTDQAVQNQKLQDENTKCRQTVWKQDQVITKLEGIVTTFSEGNLSPRK